MSEFIVVQDDSQPSVAAEPTQDDPRITQKHNVSDVEHDNEPPLLESDSDDEGMPELELDSDVDYEEEPLSEHDAANLYKDMCKKVIDAGTSNYYIVTEDKNSFLTPSTSETLDQKHHMVDSARIELDVSTPSFGCTLESNDDDAKGLLVTGPIRDCATNVGLRFNDVILQYNGKTILYHHELKCWLGQCIPGDPVHLVVKRVVDGVASFFHGCLVLGDEMHTTQQIATLRRTAGLAVYTAEPLMPGVGSYVAPAVPNAHGGKRTDVRLRNVLRTTPSMSVREFVVNIRGLAEKLYFATQSFGLFCATFETTIQDAANLIAAKPVFEDYHPNSEYGHNRLFVDTLVHVFHRHGNTVDRALYRACLCHADLYRVLTFPVPETGKKTSYCTVFLDDGEELVGSNIWHMGVKTTEHVTSDITYAVHIVMHGSAETYIHPCTTLKKAKRFVREHTIK